MQTFSKKCGSKRPAIIQYIMIRMQHDIDVVKREDYYFFYIEMAPSWTKVTKPEKQQKILVTIVYTPL